MVQYRDSATDRSPILVLHGEADDDAAIEPVREMVDWLKSMGNPVSFIAYPDTRHEFDVAGGFSGFARKLEVGVHCDLVVDLSRDRVIRIGHQEAGQVTRDTLRDYFKSCVTHGATLQYNAAARTDAIEKVHDFLKTNFSLNN
jgi:dienelactone hydrolase